MIKIELKKISVNQRLSEETNCYSADLYVDGVKWGEVCNRGQGGGDDFRGVAGKDWRDLEVLDRLIAAEFPKISMAEYGMDPMDNSLECVCGQIVEDHMVSRSVARLVKANVAFFKEPAVEGKRASLYTIAIKGRPVEVVVAHVKRMNPQAVILNEMALADQIAAYRKVA